MFPDVSQKTALAIEDAYAPVEWVQSVHCSQGVNDEIGHFR